MFDLLSDLYADNCINKINKLRMSEELYITSRMFAIQQRNVRQNMWKIL